MVLVVDPTLSDIDIHVYDLLVAGVVREGVVTKPGVIANKIRNTGGQVKKSCFALQDGGHIVYNRLQPQKTTIVDIERKLTNKPLMPWAAP